MSHVASILVIESQVSTINMYSQLIEEAGYNVVPAPDVDTASQILAGIEVDLILLTYAPDSYAWAAAFHAVPHNTDVPIIFMTHVQRRIVPADIGEAVWFMDKPLLPEAFSKEFQKVLQRIETGT